MIEPSIGRPATSDEVSVPTLPIEGVQSRVYSDKRAKASLKLDRDADLSAAHGMASLCAAVAAVLARYAEVETVPLGLCRKGIAIAVSLATPHGGTLRSIAAQATMVLDHIELDPAAFERHVSPTGSTDVAGRNPLFSVLIVLDEHPAPELRQDVTLCIDSQRTLVADYNARIFLIETVLRFLTHVNRMVVALHEASNPTLFDPRMLDASEVDDLLRLASGGAPAFNGTVQELLSSALARSSQNPVAEFGSQSWSLRELVERADAIGSVLGARVHSKGARIGVALRPGGDQIATLIAIIRLSGVIVPLDTTLPALRQAAIRTVAELTAIITEDCLLQHFTGTDPVVLEGLAALEKDRVLVSQA